jgi:membrane protein implicated in regulation of membrane protease activity
MTEMRNTTSRAWYAIAGFGLLGIGAIVLNLVLGWPFAVGWVLLVAALAIFYIVRRRRVHHSNSPDDGETVSPKTHA